MNDAIAVARARLDARERGRPAQRIEWETSELTLRCSRCKTKSGLLLRKVRQVRLPARYFADGSLIAPEQRWSGLYTTCVDGEACKERSSRAYEKRQKRSGSLRWAQSRFERADLPKGSCRWCGEPIVFVDDVPYRMKQRERHRGDEYEVGDRNCRHEHDLTFAANPRVLIQHRGDPCCVDCGDTGQRFVPNEDGNGGAWIETGEWEADHVIAVEDGGPHTPVNIARRCVDCHRRKTNAENAVRRERKRLASV